MAFDLDDEENKATRIANGASKESRDKNMDIEVGEYVRTKDGIIAQIKSIDYEADIYRFDRIIYINDFEMKNDVLYNNEMFKKVIAKHSKQLIDLIEVGDIVNKLEITSFTEKDEDHKEKIAWHNTFYGDDDIAITNNEIKTILTKESYIANCYKVGGEENERI